MNFDLNSILTEAGAVAPFVVPTPQPYAVDLAYFGNTEKARGEARSRMLARVSILYRVLALLDIDFMTAYRKNYTLNWATVETLEPLAREHDARAGKPEVMPLLRQLD